LLQQEVKFFFLFWFELIWLIIQFFSFLIPYQYNLIRRHFVKRHELKIKWQEDKKSNIEIKSLSTHNSIYTVPFDVLVILKMYFLFILFVLRKKGILEKLEKKLIGVEQKHKFSLIINFVLLQERFLIYFI